MLLKNSVVLFTLLNEVYCWPIQGVFDSITKHAGFNDGGGDTFRNLNLGSVNFIHTTDTHGWLGSHLTQKNYDADWGDFITFIDLFKSKRLLEDQDLIVIDTGDKEDGNGLSDASFPRAINSSRIFNELDYDLLTLGNHELYNGAITTQEYKYTAMSNKFKDKYVSSNVEYINDSGEAVPFGKKFVYFETQNSKTRILSLSFLFDFNVSNERVKVTPALEEVKESEWFKKMTEQYSEDSIDMLLVFGHIPMTDHQNKEINKLHEFLRSKYPNIVIQYFGGHSHIRDFVQLDTKATGLQSGRFAETVGFLSINDLKTEKPKFFRRYIDFSKASFCHHLHLDDAELFYTKKGKQISAMIQDIADELELTEVYGHVPQNYYFSTRPVNANDSIYHLLTSTILPRLNTTLSDARVGRYIMINSGSVRYDMFKGDFTKNTEYIVSPFDNNWEYIKIPNKIASKIAAYLNGDNYIITLGQPHMISKSFVKTDSVNDKGNCPSIALPFLTEGYTTSDDFGCDGDDRLHNSQREYKIPNVVQSTENLQFAQDDDIVHFVFYNFMQRNIIDAVNWIIQINKYKDKIISSDNVKKYGGSSVKLLLREYIQEISM
ncbi:hypothetical protein TPHA_0B00270 [Tetrapisispora phaffii CBS 4417]|uniref:Uncharacterized protein n=1 Tax=Tetrapisispora phaffii (strain ATCC 24235 / CBS 4417 / NBRC 1672 / NRRL Y-8282 / UCD 70-5) TaxID=1071381 RepID=G8BQA2_TETPH|nr:hypothetical protein TPHA_0B00270 [Tetrapisispora phaffii CBS 4417]CCE61699.1 hypothetical protein TPHA_0B00270 [Tetrapisispora phaffii CBS 4417]